VSLGFFNDVLIPDYALQTPSYFHEQESVWIWQWEGNSLPMDPGNEIRFRVSAIRFNPMPSAAQLAAAAAAAGGGSGGQGGAAAAGAAGAGGTAAAAAAGGGQAAAAAGGGQAAGGAAVAAATPTVYSPMEIVGDIDADGLGLTLWWKPDEEPAAAAAEDAAAAAAAAADGDAMQT
jgi:hypothetical protein